MYGYTNDATYHAMLHVDSNYSLVKAIEHVCELKGTNARSDVYDIIQFFVYNNNDVREELLGIALSDVNINELVDNYNDYMQECEEDMYN